MYRKAVFLRFLIRNLIILHIIGIIVLFFPLETASSRTEGFVVIGVSFSFIFLFHLISKKTTFYAGILTLGYFNIVVAGLMGANMLTVAYTSAIIFGCILAIVPVIAGILFDTKAALISGFINIIYSTFIFVWFRFQFPESMGALFLIDSFIFIAAFISWYFQRTLMISQERLELAREQLTRDTLLRQELAIARDLQSRLYPPPPAPDALMHLDACAVPAMETSGDLYDFIPLDEHRIGIVIADVTGKSLAAALLMAMARATFRSEARRSNDPGMVLQNVNSILCADESIRQMITAWYGILDRRTLTLRFANAGHPFPMLHRSNALIELEAYGLPLRARVDMTYPSASMTLQAGDHLLVLTDGALEAMNTEREIYGYERLCSTFVTAISERPERILAVMQESIARFHDPAPQADDITMILLSIPMQAEVNLTPTLVAAAAA